MGALFSNPGFVAVVSTIFGGVGIKLLEVWLGKAEVRANESHMMREELRHEIEGLRAMLHAAAAEEQRLEAMVDQWRNKYYDLRDEQQRTVTELTITLDRLRAMEKAISSHTEREHEI